MAVSGKKRRAQQSTTANEQVATANEQVLISVCMIVKDEETNLERCLDSVQPIADEIIVVDTGSQDRTMDIALRYGARLDQFKWCDDFAAARNAALAKATGQWILQIDADEELTVDARRQIRRVVSVAPSKCCGFFIPCRSFTVRDGVPVTTIFHRLLLFRNHPDLRYRGRIHEDLAYADIGAEPEFRRDDTLLVDHHGYMPEQMEQKEKKQRNIRLLLRAVEEDPADPYFQYHLGKHLYAVGHFEEAVAPLEKALTLDRDGTHAYLANCYAMLVTALVRLGRGKDVAGLAAQAEASVVPLTANYFCAVGSALGDCGQLDQALQYFQRAIETGYSPTAAETDPAAHTWRPRLGIGMIFEARGELDKAQARYEEAVSFVPRHPELHCRLAALAARRRDVLRALRHVAILLQDSSLDDQGSWELLRILVELSDGLPDQMSGLQEVSNSITSLIQRISPTPQIGPALSDICVRFGLPAHGIAAASTAIESSEAMDQGESFVARLNRGLCYLNLGYYQDAEVDLAIAATMQPNNARVLANLGLVECQLGQLTEAHAHLGAALAMVPGDGAVALHFAGVCLALGNEEEALEVLRRITPNTIGIVQNGTLVDGLQERYDLLCAMITRQPGDLTLRFELCDLLMQVEEWQEALRVLEGGWDFGSTAPLFQQRLAIVLIKLGQLREAAQAVQMATSLKQQQGVE